MIKWILFSLLVVLCMGAATAPAEYCLDLDTFWASKAAICDARPLTGNGLMEFTCYGRDGNIYTMIVQEGGNSV
jgi:hypothetical protein